MQGGREAPDWLSSQGMHFKDGRMKRASFAALAGTDAQRAAQRFGLRGSCGG